MSHIVTPEEFDSLAEITTNFLFTVREPRMQIKSSIQAFQHDLDKKNFSSEDEKITRAESLSIHYNTLAYNNLEEYLKRAKSLAPDRTIVVSSLATKLDPVGVLRAIADKFQWPYETVENRWTPLIDRYDIMHPKKPEPEWRDYIANHFWVKHAFKADKIMGFDRKKDAEIPLENFSHDIQQFLSDTADPIYRRMLADDVAITFPFYDQSNMEMISESNPYLVDCLNINRLNSGSFERMQ